MTEEEVRIRAYKYIESTLFNLTYESFDIAHLSNDDLRKINVQIKEIAEWFSKQKAEILKVK